MVYLIDAIIVLTLAGAVYLGATRSWKESFTSIAAHLLAMGTTWGLTELVTPLLVQLLSLYLNVSQWLPISIGFWVSPFEQNILHTVISSFLFVLFFQISKSILHAFSWVYDWGDSLFRSIRLPRVIDGILSSFFTAVHASTWLWVILLTIASPFFNMDKSFSLSGAILSTPIFLEQTTALFAPYERLQIAFTIVGPELFQVWKGDGVNIDALAAMDESDLRQLKYSLVEALPYLPLELNAPLHQVIIGIQRE
ncbi:MAG: hypothetical protein FWF59_04815 [Turicibacter sp.]|nr:hypothetical protein [Turicibacter sp.]